MYTYAYRQIGSEKSELWRIHSFVTKEGENTRLFTNFDEIKRLFPHYSSEFILEHSDHNWSLTIEIKFDLIMPLNHKCALISRIFGGLESVHDHIDRIYRQCFDEYGNSGSNTPLIDQD